jgi:hypothetical protein
MGSLTWVYDDGGREDAGYQGAAHDCVTRAIAIATRIDYADVYDDLAKRMGARGEARSARNGVWKEVYRPYLAERGWEWTPTMATIGSGCTVHLTDELHAHAFGERRVFGPPLIVRLSRHLTVVVNSQIRDTHDPSRDGTRCVYGYWRKA